MNKPVLNKRDFVKRYEKGEFGNRPLTWNTLEEYESVEHPPNQNVHLRNRSPSGFGIYDINSDCVSKVVHTLVTLGRIQSAEELYFSYMAPTERTVIQGELMRTYDGLSLFYSREKFPMRDALKIHSVTATGLAATETLKHLLPQQDLEWLMDLVNNYEDHVVEFSTYNVPFGNVPGFRTCYWEVRKY